MRRIILLAAVATVAVPLAATPANAQYGYGAQYEYQREYNAEVRECNRELRNADSRREYYNELAECQRELAEERREYQRDAQREYSRYYGSRSYGYAPSYNRYGAYSGYGGPYEPYYADQYYRDGRSYSTRSLGYNDNVYVGRDGRYYCRRSDGTTGLIIGGAVGALIGRSIEIGGSSTIGALIGGAAGAALGREVERGNVRCR